MGDQFDGSDDVLILSTGMLDEGMARNNVELPITAFAPKEFAFLKANIWACVQSIRVRVCGMHFARVFDKAEYTLGQNTDPHRKVNKTEPGCMLAAHAIFDRRDPYEHEPDNWRNKSQLNCIASLRL